MKLSKISPLVVALVSLAICVESMDEAQRDFCVDRTGLTKADIKEAITRNSGCSIDCVTEQAIILSYINKNDISCGEAASGRKCLFGKCLTSEQIEATSIGGLYAIELHILNATVPDMDTLPSTSLSDSFVSVDVLENYRPSYDQNEIMCYTHTVLDDAHPVWNHVCKPKPMRLSTALRLKVWDSDKPVVKPDFLGECSILIQEALNKGPIKYKLYSSRKRIIGMDASFDDPKYFMWVEVKGRMYEISDNY